MSASPRPSIGLAALALNLLLVIHSSAGEKPLRARLTAAGRVHGWSVLKGTYTYSSGKLDKVLGTDSATFTKAGVTAAAQQAYRHQKLGKMATITVCQTGDPARTNLLFESQSKAKASGGAKVAIAGGRAVLASGKGKTLALLAKGVFLTSVVAMGDDSEVQAAVTALLKSIASVK